MRGPLLLLLLWALGAWAAEPLPASHAESAVTVSGLSSGAYMAVQFHVAHSESVKGAGAIAGGPYYCAQGSFWKAYHHCMSPGWLTPLPSSALMTAEAERRARAGEIDATAHLAGSHVWLFSGANDATVTREVVEALHAFYRIYRVNTAMVRDKRAGHAMPTQAAGNPDCAATRSPFINDCDFDAAGALLAHLLGDLRPPREAVPGRLLRFDQRVFGDRRIGMDAQGYAYVPKECETARCRVHVAFHGCRQGRSFVGEQFVRDAGYNRWAEANRLIILYPQVAASRWGIYNPRGCWDWWGYTGSGYHTKEGAQIRAVKAMLERLSAPRR